MSKTSATQVFIPSLSLTWEFFASEVFEFWKRLGLQHISVGLEALNEAGLHLSR